MLKDSAQIEELIKKAMDNLKNAYAPYSNFHVSASLLCGDGSIYKGVNIENASYGLTNCAERTAIFSAVNDGKRDFEAICIIGGLQGKIKDFCPPCGACRQVMSEFCQPDFQIILAKSLEEYRIYSLDEVLPLSFKL